MKPRYLKSQEKEQRPPAEKKLGDPSKRDELDIQRGQNGEKGNTLKPENLRDEKEASH